jgi:hypothetical protein
VRNYIVKRAPAGADAPEWGTVPVAKIDNAQWCPSPAGLKAGAQLCYDARLLYVRLNTEERAILARYTGLYDMVCRDSCLEFFFCPLPGDGRYFNFEFNPNGAMYLGFGPNREQSARQIICGYKELFRVASYRFDGGWGITFCIPASFIQIYMPSFMLIHGQVLRGNFYKCGEDTQSPHYMAWNPMSSREPDFHRPADFGQLQFE